MKLKSLLFGSAAAIVAISGAQAADLPTAEPVNYVQICDAYGAGYFFIPGGDTCLQISGYVFGEAQYINADGAFDANFGPGDSENEFGTLTRAHVHIDARTSTELGVLRSHIRLRGDVDTRPEFDVGVGANGAFGAGRGVVVNQAFLQLIMSSGTITSGYASSAFDYLGYQNGTDMLGFLDDNSGEINQLSYRAAFGSFYAAVSIEDTFSGTHRRQDDILSGDEGYDVGGVDFPDLVGAIGIEQAWGSAQLSGAVGQISDNFAGEELGWAVNLGGSVGLGMFSVGASIGYADGLVSYISEGGGLTEFSDGDVDGSGLDANTVWRISGGASAGLTDAITVSANAFYTDYSDEDGPDDGNVWGIIGNADYTLVPGLKLTGEVGYTDVQNDGAGNIDGDAWGVGGRVRRDF